MSAWPCAAAKAQSDIFSPQTLHGELDLRASATDGEPSFNDQGFGKLRYGGDGGSNGKSLLQVATAAVEWNPHAGWAWSGVIDLIAQPGQEHSVDVDQAYVVFKPAPRSASRFVVRAGYFYPPVSLENDGRLWSLTNTITPSAIDTWIGEEVKVVGVEATVSRSLGDQSLAATAGVFGDDDTAGTLIAYRGWALHDIQSQAFGRYKLPPLAPLIAGLQDSESYSTREIDNRLGAYVRLEWRPTPSLALHAFYYDNNGDGTDATPDQQWAWSTRFWEAGLSWDIDERTRLLAQALAGRTSLGPANARFADVDFHAAYVLARRSVGKGAFSGRLDLFDTDDLAPRRFGDTSETGWALTGAWRYPLNRYLDVRLEALRVDSTRAARVLAGETPHQAQTEVQSSLRVSF
ncbi:MAG TPA: hypothetical protein VKU90_12100 [Caulobacteraceae bacterium]|nr:hypothetical protein [Caulobacteraceae bacterium]